MILCSCNVLTVSRVREAARRLAEAEPGQPVTAGRVLRALGLRGHCGTCIPLMRAELRKLGLTVPCPESIATVAEEATEQAA